MIKKYSAKTHVSLSVPFANGGVKHISFRQLTGGGSIYFTSDAEEQSALESHSKFGKLFKLENVQPDVVNAQAEEVVENPAPTNSVVVKKVTLQIPVSSLPDAKEYLAEKFGISRSKLRSEVSIKAIAKENNIEFIGI